MRSIYEKWEVSQNKQSPFEPIKIIKESIIPYESPEEYVSYINECHPQTTYRYDEFYKMPGRYTSAELIDNIVWVVFTPEKLGDYWLILPN